MSILHVFSSAGKNSHLLGLNVLMLLMLNLHSCGKLFGILIWVSFSLMVTLAVVLLKYKLLYLSSLLHLEDRTLACYRICYTKRL